MLGIDDERPPKRQDTGGEKGRRRKLPRNADLAIRSDDNAATGNSLRGSPSIADRKASWLSVLTREELAKLAAGAEWQPGDSHPNKCFVCDIANELLNCQQCSRSYHATCLHPPLDPDMAPDSWTCPACALLDAQGATHTYLLDQPYQRQEARRMTRVESTLDISVGRLETSQGENHARLSQRQREDIPQPNPAGSVQSTPRTRATESQDRSFLSRLDLDTSVPPNAIEKANMSTDDNHQSKRKKRSRYGTLPNDVDEALATINRQLEAGVHLKGMLEHVTARNQALEQQLQIEKGKSLLAARNQQTAVELNALRIRSKDMEHELSNLREQNQHLTADVERYLKKIKDLEAWKLRMKAMVDGDAEDQ